LFRGNGALGPNFPDADLVAGFDAVAMDDFLYSNPVPEQWGLLGVGVGAVLVLRRSRAR
jgi:hypothetical protein